MSAHTPGPWSWYRGTEVLNADGEQVLAIDLPEFISDGDKHLIAAAPDLLAVCRVFLDRIAGADGADAMWADAEAAIAKAEGRS